MESMQIPDPVHVFTQAALVSLLSGSMAFMSTILSSVLIKPMVNVLSKNLSEMIKGGVTSVSEGNFMFPLPFMLPPPPISFSYSPEGMLTMNIHTNRMAEYFAPLFSLMGYNAGGESK